MSSRPPKVNNKEPTPEEAMALILSGSVESEKKKLSRELVKGNKKYKNNPDKEDKRDKIKEDVKKDIGITDKKFEDTAVEIYDELAALGMLDVRR